MLIIRIKEFIIRIKENPSIELLLFKTEKENLFEYKE